MTEKALSKQVVVARYKENLNWLRHFDLETVVYNKSKLANINTSSFEISFDHKGTSTVRQVTRPLLLPNRKSLPHILPERQGIRVVDLENSLRGREAHTYLYHIFHNYSHLANQTFFLQGNPLVHSPELFSMMQCEYEKPSSLTPFYMRRCQLLDGIEESACERVVRYGRGEFTQYFPKMSVVWKELFPDVPIPNPFYFGYGAMWAVPRKSIIARKRSFYEYLLREIERIDGWVMELLWRYIFASPKEYPDLTCRKLPYPIML
jgi:hypothetical protein